MIIEKSPSQNTFFNQILTIPQESNCACFFLSCTVIFSWYARAYQIHQFFLACTRLGLDHIFMSFSKIDRALLAADGISGKFFFATLWKLHENPFLRTMMMAFAYHLSQTTAEFMCILCHGRKLISTVHFFVLFSPFEKLRTFDNPEEIFSIIQNVLYDR